MQVNTLQTILTPAVASTSNRPAIIAGLSIAGLSISELSQAEAPRVVIEPEAVSALSIDTSRGKLAQHLQSRLGDLLEYEQNTRGHQGAIAQYLQTQHAAKREEIQQMVGVDIYV